LSTPQDLLAAGATPVSEAEVRTGISLRAILIGLVFVAVVCFIVSYSEMVTGSLAIGFLQMPPAAIGIFFILVLANRYIRRVGARLALNAGEMMMVYCMMVVAAMVASRGIMEKIIPLLVAPNYFASPDNKWQQLFFPHIRKWMVSFDPSGRPNQFVAKSFYEGLRSGDRIPWGDWIVPLAWWGVLVLLIIFAFLCLATILRKQWVDNERLPFPLAQLPVALVQETPDKPFLGNRMLWAGVAVPTVVFTLNGLRGWYPTLPFIPLWHVINDWGQHPYFVDPPWNAMYFTTVSISFAAIGFFFLLPSDVIFGIWFFAILARLQGVAATACGMETPGMPMFGTPLFVAYQTVGAYFVLAGFMFYTAAPHIRHVVRAAFGTEPANDEHEMIPYRVAFWGLLGALALVIAWSMMAGMSFPIALLEFGVFIFVIAVVMARSTAEAGMLMTETTFRPMDLRAMILPEHTLGIANATGLSFLDSAFLRDQRGLLLTAFLDGLKITDGVNVRRRSFLPVFAVGILLALVFAGYMHIMLPYSRGANSLYQYIYQGNALNGFRHYGAAMGVSQPPHWQAGAFFGVGLVVTAFLAYMRMMFYWWPLHPLGYALSVSWTSTLFWFPCLVAWILKTTVLRYGGMRPYVRARPFFLGMILGEFGMAVIWATIGALTGAPTPEFPWG
jgi:hypothetical protein